MDQHPLQKESLHLKQWYKIWREEIYIQTATFIHVVHRIVPILIQYIYIHIKENLATVLMD